MSVRRYVDSSDRLGLRGTLRLVRLTMSTRPTTLAYRIDGIKESIPHRGCGERVECSVPGIQVRTTNYLMRVSRE